MPELDNHTVWEAGLYPGQDRNGAAQQTLVVKCCYRFDLRGELAAAPWVEPIHVGHQHRGDPADSSLRHADDTVPFKTGGEWLAFGTAYPSAAGDVVRKVSVSLRRGEHSLCNKALAVSGERQWEVGLLGALATAPAPLRPTPVIYEFAHGGVDTRGRAVFLANPAGIGYRRRHKPRNGDPVPPIQPVDRLILRPSHLPAEAVGFGPIPPNWAPRFDPDAGPGHAGDATTMAHQYHAAPSDQWLDTPFEAGDCLRLEGWFADVAVVTLQLPACRPDVLHATGRRVRRFSPQCDTLAVDCDARTLSMVWRTALPADNAEAPCRVAVTQAPDLQAGAA